MSPGDFFQLGKITRTHGVKGHLVVHLDAQHPSHYKKSKEMFLMMNNVLQKFTVKEISITGNTARVLFNEIDSLTKAEDYKKLLSLGPEPPSGHPGEFRAQGPERESFQKGPARI